jgi:hypothetical protein
MEIWKSVVAHKEKKLARNTEKITNTVETTLCNHGLWCYQPVNVIRHHGSHLLSITK